MVQGSHNVTSDEHKEFVTYRLNQLDGKLDTISAEVKAMSEQFGAMRTDLAVVKVKSGFLGGLFGTFGAALASLAAWLLK